MISSGSSVAVCWATLNKIGHAGYVKRAANVLKTTQKIRRGIERNKHLQIMGDPKGTVLAFRSETVDIFQVRKKHSIAFHFNFS